MFYHQNFQNHPPNPLPGGGEILDFFLHKSQPQQILCQELLLAQFLFDFHFVYMKMFGRALFMKKKYIKKVKRILKGLKLVEIYLIYNQK